MIKFLARRAWIIALIALIFLFPQALTSQARLNNRILITGLGIDKIENEYEITAQVVIPKGGSDASGEPATLEAVSAKGISLIEGLRKVSYKIGKIAGLSHLSYIVLGESMFEENILPDLDYFLREAQIPNSVMLVFSSTSAQEEITNLDDMEITTSLGLQKIYLYKEESLNSNMKTLAEFVQNAKTPSKIGVMPELKITKERNTSSDSGNSSGNNEAEKQGGGRIIYYTPFAYFKNGNYVGTISDEKDIVAYLLTQAGGDRFDMVIEDVCDDSIYKEANVGIRILDKKVKTSVKFIDNKPLLCIDIVLDKVKLMEVNDKGSGYQGAFTTLKPYKNMALENKIKDQISESIVTVFQQMKNHNIDIYNLANNAKKFNNGNWNYYLKSLPNIEDYLQNVQIVVNVEIKSFT